MPDRDWPAPMALEAFRLELPGLCVCAMDPGPMAFINGDLAAGLAEAGLDRAHGWPGEAAGPRYGVRLGRDKALVVGAAMGGGWRGSFGVTEATDGLASFELRGEGLSGALGRFGEMRLERPSASAAFLIGEFQAILYRHEGAALRVHVARSLEQAFMAHLETVLG